MSRRTLDDYPVSPWRDGGDYRTNSDGYYDALRFLTSDVKALRQIVQKYNNKNITTSSTDTVHMNKYGDWSTDEVIDINANVRTSTYEATFENELEDTPVIEALKNAIIEEHRTDINDTENGLYVKDFTDIIKSIIIKVKSCVHKLVGKAGIIVEDDGISINYGPSIFVHNDPQVGDYNQFDVKCKEGNMYGGGLQVDNEGLTIVTGETTKHNENNGAIEVKLNDNCALESTYNGVSLNRGAGIDVDINNALCVRKDSSINPNIISITNAGVGLKAGNGLAYSSTNKEVSVRGGTGINITAGSGVSAKPGTGITVDSTGINAKPGNGITVDNVGINVNTGVGTAINTTNNTIEVVGGDGLNLNTTTNAVDVVVGDGLEIGSYNDIKAKISQEPNNALIIESDGLYVNNASGGGTTNEYFKGTYPTFADLTTALPNPQAGWYAYYYETGILMEAVWNASTNAWDTSSNIQDGIKYHGVFETKNDAISALTYANEGDIFGVSSDILTDPVRYYVFDQSGNATLLNAVNNEVSTGDDMCYNISETTSDFDISQVPTNSNNYDNYDGLPLSDAMFYVPFYDSTYEEKTNFGMFVMLHRSDYKSTNNDTGVIKRNHKTSLHFHFVFDGSFKADTNLRNQVILTADTINKTYTARRKLFIKLEDFLDKITNYLEYPYIKGIKGFITYRLNSTNSGYRTEPCEIELEQDAFCTFVNLTIYPRNTTEVTSNITVPLIGKIIQDYTQITNTNRTSFVP